MPRRARAPEMCYIAIMNPKSASGRSHSSAISCLLPTPVFAPQTQTPTPSTKNAPCTQRRVILPYIGPICGTLSHLVALKSTSFLSYHKKKGRISCHKGRKTGSTFSDFGRLWSTSDTLSIPFLPTPQGRSLCTPLLMTLGFSLSSPRVRAVPGD